MGRRLKFHDKEALMKKLLTLFISGLWLLCFAGLSFAQAQKEIHIGCAVAMTGRVSPEGKQLMKGAEVWQKAVNDQGGINVGGQKYKVKITFYDDKSDAATGTKLTEKLITEDKVQFLFGPFSSGITFATSAIGERYRMITIAPLANATNIYERGFKYVFSILPPAPKLTHPIFDLAATLNPKPKTVAIIIANDLFPLSAAEGAKERAEQLGFSVVLFQKYPAETSDVTTLLTMVKDKSPDILLTSGYNKDALMVARQAREVDLNVKVLAFTEGVMNPEFLKSLGPDGNYVVEGEWWLPTLKNQDKVFGTTENFGNLYKKMHGETLEYHASAGAAAGVLLQMAIEKAGSFETDAIRKVLLSMDVHLSCFPRYQVQ